MRVLFISDFILADEQGAKQSSKAHYKSLQDIFGYDNVDVVSINSKYEPFNDRFVYIESQPTKIEKLINIFHHSCFFLSKAGEERIVKICYKNKYGLVFIDHSIYGYLAARIKMECNIPIVAYFHGIMAYQVREYERISNTSLLYFIPKINTLKNEKLTTQYVDKCLVLNQRDEANFVKFYKTNPDGYLPVYYEDTAEIVSGKVTENYEILFVGGYFWPNIHGITWFVKNVISELSEGFHLTIVGNGMDKLRPELESNRVTVLGHVDTLDVYYNMADAVVGPIFEGEGMKTKTCEALMYGKVYLGTNEALEGYIGLDKYKCNTAEEYLKMLTELKKKSQPKYHEDMRQLYEDYYSPQRAKETLVRVFESMGL